MNGPDVPPEAPYSLQIGAQFYRTTGGYQDHKLVFDLPALAGGRLRADLQIGWEKWGQAYYFGQGNRLPRLRPENTPENRYAFGLHSVRAVSKVRWQLVGDWHVFGGFLVRTAAIDVYPGGLLSEDAPVGTKACARRCSVVDGDSRDHEFAPRTGLSEASVRTSQPLMGSTWRMWGWDFTHRQYWSLGSRVGWWPLGVVDQQRGETRFPPNRDGGEMVDIGGPLAMRGLPIGRYRGEGLCMVMQNCAGRWPHFLSGAPAVCLAPCECCRIIEPGEKDKGLHPHSGVGWGTRLLYNGFSGPI